MKSPFHKADPKWWSCERKKRFDSEPLPPKEMLSYKCKYCDGWHLTTEKRNDGEEARKEGTK